MKKHFVMTAFLLVAVFVLGEGFLRDPASRAGTLTYAAEKKDKKGNECIEAAEFAAELASDYRKAAKNVAKLGRYPESDEFSAALKKAAEAFEALQLAHEEMMETCGQGTDPPDPFNPDQYEPNNTYESFYHLGTVVDAETLVLFANFHDPSIDRHDWYDVGVEDPDKPCLPGFPESFLFTVTLSDIPLGSDYDLYVYDESGNFLADSTAYGNADEFVAINWQGTCGVDDSTYFTFEVRHFSGPATAEEYSVEVSFFGD